MIKITVMRPGDQAIVLDVDEKMDDFNVRISKGGFVRVQSIDRGEVLVNTAQIIIVTGS